MRPLTPCHACETQRAAARHLQGTAVAHAIAGERPAAAAAATFAAYTAAAHTAVVLRPWQVDYVRKLEAELAAQATPAPGPSQLANPPDPSAAGLSPAEQSAKDVSGVAGVQLF